MIITVYNYIQQMVKQAEESKVPKHPKSKLDRFQKAGEQEEEAVDEQRKTWKTSAAIYLGHLPQGFEEQELKKYFEQYGDVLAVKLCRSKKTARSKGFGFVQFRYPEVAAIAADAMNNYMILGKFLKCHTLEEGKPNPFTHRQMTERTKFINWKQIFILQKNKVKTQEQTKKQVEKLIAHENQKRNKLKEMKIAYEFPGFSAIVNPE